MLSTLYHMMIITIIMLEANTHIYVCILALLACGLDVVVGGGAMCRAVSPKFAHD